MVLKFESDLLKESETLSVDNYLMFLSKLSEQCFNSKPGNLVQAYGTRCRCFYKQIALFFLVFEKLFLDLFAAIIPVSVA